MRRHASLTANLPSLSLASVFQAAAGRAWAKTRPTRAYHRTGFRGEGQPSTLLAAHGGHDGRGGTGGPSTTVSPSNFAASNPLPEDRRRATPSLPALVAVGTELPSRIVLSDADNRGPRPMRSRAPQRRGVTFVDVETLSAHECEPSRHGWADRPAYEDEPPWEELRASVPESLLPWVTVFQPKQSPLQREARTAEELVQNLVHSITGRPHTSLGKVLSYHAAHRTLHSTASFNVVMRYAIRCASFGTVGELLAEMVREDIGGDEETRALRVRSMVRSGFWNMAWEEEMAEMQRSGRGMRLPVWLEFLGSVKRGAILAGGSRSWTRAEAGRGGRQPLKTPDPTVAAARLHGLMEHAPVVNSEEWEQVPPRVVHALVRSLVQLGRRTAALELTRSYFQSLPEQLETEWQAACLSIIHLHMPPGRGCNLSAHFAALSTLFALLDMHPSFEPTSTTLFFLLRTLKGTKSCGERADKLVLSFQKRWGPDILDDRVRRRWASLWLKQGRPGRAQAIAEAQHVLDVQRLAWRAEKDVMGEASDKDRRRRLRWLDLHRSPRRGKQQWHWRRLRRRVWREHVRSHPR